MIRGSVFTIVLCLATALGFPELSRAETVVRLSLGAARQAVEASGKNLRVLDGDVLDELARFRSGPIRLTASPNGIRIPGCRNHPRSLVLQSDSAIRVDRRQLVGQVEVRWKTDRLLVINRLPLERYLQGVLGAEMSGRWPVQALKAQAVAARTYFLHRRLLRENEDFDMSSTVLDQVYRGIGQETSRTRKAVAETRGEVLTWENQPAETLFHACCGGTTRSAEEVFSNAVPYLKSVADPDCSACPRHRWSLDISFERLAHCLREADGFKGAIETVTPVHGQAFRDRLIVTGRDGQRRMLSSRKLRNLMGADRLPSNAFSWEVRSRGHVIHLEGRGSGHGVGMCQWGAKGMAEKGRTYREILQRYYPGCQLRKMY